MIGQLFTPGRHIDADWQQVKLFVADAACRAKKSWLIPTVQGKGELAPQRGRLGFAGYEQRAERLGRRL
jgi:hypothetical protein